MVKEEVSILSGILKLGGDSSEKGVVSVLGH